MTTGSDLLAGNPGENAGTPPAADPPAGAPPAGTPPAADPPAGDPPAAPALKLEGFDVPPERAEYVKNKGWKTAGDMLDSYANLEQVVGLERGGQADRILVAPKADAKPEEVAAFWDKAAKVGVPEDVAGYGIQVPDGLDPAPFEEIGGMLHKAGIPKPLADKLLTEGFAAEQAKVEAFGQQSVKDVQDLQAELRDKFDDTMETARRGFSASGLDKESIQRLEMAVGTKAMLKMFAEFGKHYLEAPAPNTQQAGQQPGNQFRMTKEQAVEKQKALMNDDGFMARYLSPNIQTRQAAIAEMEQLAKAATGTA
jgi:hypothetical protein